MKNLEITKEKFKNDGFAKKMGIKLDDLTEDTVKMRMELDDSLNNFYQRPHGGAIYGLADAAFSVIGNNDNNISVAVECSISYHSSPDPGEILFVEGEKIFQTRRIGTYLFTVYVIKDEEMDIVATMKSTLYRTGKAMVDDQGK